MVGHSNSALVQSMGLYFCFCHLILNFHLETFPENSFNLFHSDWISTWCCVDVLRTVLSLTDYSSDGDWYKGPIWLKNSCILSCKMLPTTALLKPDVPDVRWLLRRSSSCWVMNGTKFAYVLSISSFLRQGLSVSLKIMDACTLL